MQNVPLSVSMTQRNKTEKDKLVLMHYYIYYDMTAQF